LGARGVSSCEVEGAGEESVGGSEETAEAGVPDASVAGPGGFPSGGCKDVVWHRQYSPRLSYGGEREGEEQTTNLSQFRPHSPEPVLLHLDRVRQRQHTQIRMTQHGIISRLLCKLGHHRQRHQVRIPHFDLDALQQRQPVKVLSRTLVPDLGEDLGGDKVLGREPSEGG
jgi:hypothetical protein